MEKLKKRQLSLLALALLAIVQLSVPIGMIWESEEALSTGTPFKFKVAPVDPNDPFRGKYITLNFEARSFSYPADTSQTWSRQEKVYVGLAADSSGFAQIASVSRKPPQSEPNYVMAEVQSFYQNGREDILLVTYPFNRFYMEESKALLAEQLYRSTLLDPEQLTYALVYVQEGKAVLKDVLLNGQPIAEAVKARQNRKTIDK